MIRDGVVNLMRVRINAAGYAMAADRISRGGKDTAGERRILYGLSEKIDDHLSGKDDDFLQINPPRFGESIRIEAEAISRYLKGHKPQTLIIPDGERIVQLEYLSKILGNAQDPQKFDNYASDFVNLFREWEAEAGHRAAVLMNQRRG